MTDVAITDTIPKHTTYVENSADHDGVYSDGVLTWTIDEVPAWGKVTVAFMVKVDENVEAETITNKAIVKEGNNTYTTNSVTNYTVDDDVNKEVFTASKTDVSLDGKKVTPGEELVYKIYYKNSSSEKAIVTITDKISEYTTYVDGSADNNGVYEDGVITWNLEVAAGETVAVSFKATVKDVPGAKVANTATIVEGKNSYTTNEVVNQIPAAPTTPDNSDLPQTGGNARLGMWTALLVLGCSGLIVTSIYSKKKNKSEE